MSRVFVKIGAQLPGCLWLKRIWGDCRFIDQQPSGDGHETVRKSWERLFPGIVGIPHSGVQQWGFYRTGVTKGGGWDHWGLTGGWQLKQLTPSRWSKVSAWLTRN